MRSPYVRCWCCTEKLSGYIVELIVGDREVSEFIDRYYWQGSSCKPEILRCAIQRLQRKMFYEIFPTFRGKFQCDWEL